MICPAPARSLYGNSVTARRWARILRQLGHRVSIRRRYEGERCLLVALHACRSADSVLRYTRENPGRPVIIALTGTDLYRDLRHDSKGRLALNQARRLIALQPLAGRELPRAARAKVRVIYQSARATPGRAVRPRRTFDACVVGHLRDVKDPFRAALASRLLPACSRVRILQAGVAMEDAMARAARREEQQNPRYRWLGGLPRWQARRLIARSQLLVSTSVMEGGGNVISEALVDGTPVLASRIPGSVGLLGPGYPGYFPTGNTTALARLLARAETDRAFYAKITAWCARLAPQFDPRRELDAWRALLEEISRGPAQ
jgi:putative glycosyltransferase (TIGR04348 family)